MLVAIILYNNGVEVKFARQKSSEIRIGFIAEMRSIAKIFENEGSLIIKYFEM